MFFFIKNKELFESGGLIGIDLTNISPDSSSGNPINPTKGDRAFEKGGKVSDKFGQSGTITDKNSLLKGKMGLIVGEEGANYLVKVDERTVLVSKKGIDIVKPDKPKLEVLEKGGKVDSDDTITAYCMATKTKGVVMQDVVVKRTSKGGYIAHGTDGKGNKMVAMLSKEKGARLIK